VILHILTTTDQDVSILSKTLKRFLFGAAILGGLALVVAVSIPAIASAQGGQGGFDRHGMMAPGPWADNQVQGW